MRYRALALSLLVTATTASSVADAGENAAPAWIKPAQGAAADVAANAWSGAKDLGVFALGLLGVRYRYGGNDPQRGLDCSGLVQYVFEQVTGVTLPRTSRELAKIGDRIGIGDLEPGDLVFFNTRHFAFSHVGLYLGENRFIHAPSRGRDVAVALISDSYWKNRFDGARRLIGVIPPLVPTLASPALAAEALGHNLELPALADRDTTAVASPPDTVSEP